MAHRALCASCRHRPAVPGERRCRTCLVISKALDPPRIGPRGERRRRPPRRAMRDWQRPAEQIPSKSWEGEP